MAYARVRDVMPRLLNRIVVLLLVPSLLGEPILATALTPASFHSSCFNEQAIAPPDSGALYPEPLNLAATVKDIDLVATGLREQRGTIAVVFKESRAEFQEFAEAWLRGDWATVIRLGATTEPNALPRIETKSTIAVEIRKALVPPPFYISVDEWLLALVVNLVEAHTKGFVPGSPVPLALSDPQKENLHHVFMEWLVESRGQAGSKRTLPELLKSYSLNGEDYTWHRELAGVLAEITRRHAAYNADLIQQARELAEGGYSDVPLEERPVVALAAVTHLALTDPIYLATKIANIAAELSGFRIQFQNHKADFFDSTNPVLQDAQLNVMESIVNHASLVFSQFDNLSNKEAMSFPLRILTELKTSLTKVQVLDRWRKSELLLQEMEESERDRGTALSIGETIKNHLTKDRQWSSKLAQRLKSASAVSLEEVNDLWIDILSCAEFCRFIFELTKTRLFLPKVDEAPAAKRASDLQRDLEIKGPSVEMAAELESMTALMRAKRHIQMAHILLADLQISDDGMLLKQAEFLEQVLQSGAIQKEQALDMDARATQHLSAVAEIFLGEIIPPSMRSQFAPDLVRQADAAEPQAVSWRQNFLKTEDISTFERLAHSTRSERQALHETLFALHDVDQILADWPPGDDSTRLLRLKASRGNFFELNGTLAGHILQRDAKRLLVAAQLRSTESPDNPYMITPIPEIQRAFKAPRRLRVGA